MDVVYGKNTWEKTFKGLLFYPLHRTYVRIFAAGHWGILKEHMFGKSAANIRIEKQRKT